MYNITFAYTFSDLWWLGYSPDATPDQSAGVLKIYYTYPDSVFTGQQFNVGVTLNYVKDSRALVDWIVFSKVSVGLKDYQELVNHFATQNRDDNNNYPPNLKTGYDLSSHLIYPGQQYSFSFNFTAPLTSGKYVIFPKWGAFYGPGTIASNNFIWDLEKYYNQTDRKIGSIDPSEILPIEVKERNVQVSKANTSLDVFFDSPYSDLKTIKATIKDTTDPKIEYSGSTNNNGYVLFDVPINKTYLLTVPKVIDIIPNKIRAIFVNWTDGKGYPSIANGVKSVDNISNVSRLVNLQHDIEFTPLYKTQYFLKVNSENNINLKDKNGTGWYDNGVDAQFTANTFASYFSLHSFDHWNGTIPKGENTESSSVTTMNGPKEVTAIWKFDYGYLGAYIGILTGSATVIGKVYSNHRSIKNVLRHIGNKNKKNDKLGDNEHSIDKRNLKSKNHRDKLNKDKERN